MKPDGNVAIKHVLIDGSNVDEALSKGAKAN